ncbi:ABC transporter ATP-binding protein [Corynebacterium stationis]|uniref:ABC transporter ATP-binding protein n=1 Tax=Corynebacterium stationis TaxID=1705 RepID=UPI00076F80FD|nr:ABC transporter ATP-binding protein [Corynebacterium stationis]AMJ43876.1 macrolide ABC transporter ATP-binding protein [Corynebacterium stationis]APT94204.1 macrolide ABC transporter ATP-binding protein [Corynebacterium stationis]AQX70331.1 macrolide ABC transporter ATP-binding protein [Corynebacterium stationis]ASJ18026.1 macrolide ABC transporter ATP-binding protein [Corynebacterium stationis]HJG64762.1 ABC transporter ATP-binding protein [Corynebacterium stationis]
MENNTAAVLHLNDVTKDFGGAPVLSGITLDINAGETVAIMGPSGSGKSTLLHCMSGVLTPTSGQVLFKDAVLSDASDAARSRTRLADFGFVFQDHQLLPELSALDNVALPEMLNGTSRSKARAKAQELLNQLGLGSMVDRRPGQVSGGQAQRIAIARALVTSPAVIFADEPTGALDQATGHEVMQLLTAVVQRTGAALVMVTHDSRVADWMERRIEIRDGIIHDDRLVGGRR